MNNSIKQTEGQEQTNASANGEAFSNGSGETEWAAGNGKPGSAYAVETATGTLLREVREYVRRFVVLDPEQIHITSLWVLHTYVFTAFEQTPYLHIKAPEKQSGKTRLLEVLNLLVREPWMIQLPSEAVLFRKINEEPRPTLLLDEVDAIFTIKGDPNTEGVRALLNGGNREDSKVPRLVGPHHKPKDFSTFCPKAIAGIGSIPDTVADRAVPIFMKRKTEGETVERFRRRLPDVKDPARSLRDRMMKWAGENWEALNESWPKFPDDLSDRQMDNAEPLLAIADLAAGGCPERSRDALVEIYARYAEAEGISIQLTLLGDCRTVFLALAESEKGIISSSDLLLKLQAMKESPWGDTEKPLTHRRIAFHLGKYEIRSKDRKLNGTTLKSFDRADFEDAWVRWLPQRGTP